MSDPNRCENCGHPMGEHVAFVTPSMILDALAYGVPGLSKYGMPPMICPTARFAAQKIHFESREVTR